MNTTLFILTGLPGSGKTTYANGLAKETGAKIFSLDTEMHKRYGEDHHIDLEIREKATKYDLLQEMEQMLLNGTSIIADFGFYKEAERKRYLRFAKQLGVYGKVVFVTAPYETLLQRVEERNKITDNIHHIDKEILDALIERYEEPTESESPEVIKT